MTAVEHFYYPNNSVQNYSFNYSGNNIEKSTMTDGAGHTWNYSYDYSQQPNLLKQSFFLEGLAVNGLNSFSGNILPAILSEHSLTKWFGKTTTPLPDSFVYNYSSVIESNRLKEVSISGNVNSNIHFSYDCN